MANRPTSSLTQQQQRYRERWILQIRDCSFGRSPEALESSRFRCSNLLEKPLMIFDVTSRKRRQAFAGTPFSLSSQTRTFWMRALTCC